MLRIMKYNNKVLLTLVIAVFQSLILMSDIVKIKAAYASQVSLTGMERMLNISDNYSDPLLRGIKLNPNNPFEFDFIIDSADKDSVDKHDVSKLIEYFLAGLTANAEDIWVNLSPYEKDRITSDVLATTDLGRDLLEQDYILKQLSSSLTFPEKTTGKAYWNRANKQKTNKHDLSKIWISPKLAQVYEHENTVLISQASLKVDTQANNSGNAGNAPTGVDNGALNALLPAIEKEVNEGGNFSKLRQIYHSLILADWFKSKLKDSVYKHYINQSKTKGLDINDPAMKEKIWAKYNEAFKKGTYDYIKKDINAQSGRLEKKRYFSGGYTHQNIVQAVSVQPEYTIFKGDLVTTARVNLKQLNSSSSIQTIDFDLIRSTLEDKFANSNSIEHINAGLVGRKRFKQVDESIKATPMQGIAISHILGREDAESELFSKLITLKNNLENDLGETLAKKIVFLDPNSYHVTIADIAALPQKYRTDEMQNKIRLYLNKFIDTNSDMAKQTVNVTVKGIDMFAAPGILKFNLDIPERHVLDGWAAKFWQYLESQDESFKGLYNDVPFKPGEVTYHISVGYIYDALTQDEVQILIKALEKSFNQNQNLEFAMPLGKANGFDDMNTFYYLDENSNMGDQITSSALFKGTWLRTLALGVLTFFASQLWAREIPTDLSQKGNTVIYEQNDENFFVSYNDSGVAEAFLPLGGAAQYTRGNNHIGNYADNFYPVVEPLLHVAEDLAASGHNTVKIYLPAENLSLADQTKVGNLILKLYEDYGIRTNLMHFAGQYAQNNELLKNPTASNIAKATKLIEDFAKWTKTLGDAVAFVQLGNEIDYYVAGAGLAGIVNSNNLEINMSPTDFYTYMNNLAGAYKAINPDHPVALGLGILNEMHIELLKNSVSNYDLIKTNGYANHFGGRPATGVPELDDFVNFLDHQSQIAKAIGLPLGLGEFGESSTNYGLEKQALFMSRFAEAVSYFTPGSNSSYEHNIIASFVHEYFPENWKNSAIHFTESGLALFNPINDSTYQAKPAFDSLSTRYTQLDSVFNGHDIFDEIILAEHFDTTQIHYDHVNFYVSADRRWVNHKISLSQSIDPTISYAMRIKVREADNKAMVGQKVAVRLMRETDSDAVKDGLSFRTYEVDANGYIVVPFTDFVLSDEHLSQIKLITLHSAVEAWHHKLNDNGDKLLLFDTIEFLNEKATSINTKSLHGLNEYSNQLIKVAITPGMNLNIEGPFKKSGYVNLFNLAGRKIDSYYVDSKNKNITVRIGNIAPGTYILDKRELSSSAVGGVTMSGLNNSYKGSKLSLNWDNVAFNDDDFLGFAYSVSTLKENRAKEFVQKLF